jgi:Cdc6-like AAA superfamily ATPase
VLFYDVSEKTLLERCLVRAANSEVKREDDHEETLKKRLRNFNDLSKPVVDMYAKFGKVKHIDASKSVNEVFEATKKAMLPEIFFMIGPKGSGKSSVAKKLGDRANMQVINFKAFLAKSGINPDDYDDEEATLALVHHLVNETSPRILVEDFPRNEKQARLFIRNSVKPSEVFYVRCSKDIC